MSEFIQNLSTVITTSTPLNKSLSFYAWPRLQFNPNTPVCPFKTSYHNSVHHHLQPHLPLLSPLLIPYMASFLIKQTWHASAPGFLHRLCPLLGALFSKISAWHIPHTSFMLLIKKLVSKWGLPSIPYLRLQDIFPPQLTPNPSWLILYLILATALITF